jgi:hypothetical protein
MKEEGGKGKAKEEYEVRGESGGTGSAKNVR